MSTGLTVNLKGVAFRNPIMSASGTFGYGDEMSDITDLSLYGAIVTKSLTLLPREGNPPPRIVETPCGMINSIGLANIGVENFINDKLPFLREVNSKLIVNIAGKNEDEYLKVLEKLELQEGIHGYEINLSCPNVKEGGIEFGKSPETVGKLTGKLRRITNRILIIKLTPNVTSIETIARAAEDSGADAVSVINTVYGMAVDIETRKPLINSIVGGLSGPAIKPIALANVYKTFKAVKIPVIGIGGISSGKDVIEFLLSGATMVQLGTVHFKNPTIIKRVIEDISSYLERHSIEDITSLTGKLDLD